jgi:tetratricopeptide (TPR) repeat protein
MRTGVFRLYYYGPKRWDDYLLDLQEAQDEAAEAAAAATEEMNEELKKQTALHERQVELANEMKLEMQWGFGLVVDRLDRQTKLVADIAEKLDEILKTLKSPLITQATELWQLGEDYFNRGLLDRALEKFLQSEQKNDVFFPLQLRIGTLYLEGRNDECNVINLPEAERHLLLAARYALAEGTATDNASEYAGKAYYRAAQAAYLIGADYQRSGNEEEKRKCLERALGHLRMAAKYWPEFRGILFLRAKCNALLGNNREALDVFRTLSDSDRSFHAAAMEDNDFSRIRHEVDGVFRLAIDRPGPNAAKAKDIIARARIVLDWAKTKTPPSKSNKPVIEAFEQALNVFEEQLRTLSVDIETGIANILKGQKQLEDIVWKHLWNMEETLSDRIKSLRGERNTLGQSHNPFPSEGSGGIGCLFAVIMCFVLFLTLTVLAVTLPVFFPAIGSALSKPTSLLGVLIFLAGFIVFGFLMFPIGKYLSLRTQKRNYRINTDRAKERLREWDLVHAPVIAGIEFEHDAAKQRQYDFADVTVDDTE